jgi:hypothetical protein
MPDDGQAILPLAKRDEQCGIKVGADFEGAGGATAIVDLGKGPCFRRPAA